MAVYYVSGCPCCASQCDGYSLIISVRYDTSNNYAWVSTDVAIYDANGQTVLTESWSLADTMASLGMPSAMQDTNDYTAAHPDDISWTLSCGTVTIPADAYTYQYTPAAKAAHQPWMLTYSF